MHSIYFIGYGGFITASALLMAAAFYSRFKRRGTPINYTSLALVSGLALFMWTGAALTEYVYNPSAVTAGFVIVALAVWFSVGVVWQVKAYLKRHPMDGTL
jgi:hypothetical protein